MKVYGKVGMKFCTFLSSLEGCEQLVSALATLFLSLLFNDTVNNETL
jgi:hypothetical protein